MKYRAPIGFEEVKKAKQEEASRTKKAVAQDRFRYGGYSNNNEANEQGEPQGLPGALAASKQYHHQYHHRQVGWMGWPC